MSVDEAWEHVIRIAGQMGTTAHHLLDMLQERASTDDSAIEVRRLRKLSMEVLHALYRVETGQSLGRTVPDDLADRIYKARQTNGPMTHARLTANMKGIKSMLLSTYIEMLNGTPEENDSRYQLIAKLLKAYKAFI